MLFCFVLAIYISGDTKVPCGNTAHFEAEISTEKMSICHSTGTE